MKEIKGMKEITIKAGLKDENLFVESNQSQNMSESFELLGVYEFIKKEFGGRFASFISIRICYNHLGLYVNQKIIKRRGNIFQIKNVCDELIEGEINKIHKRLEIKKEKV